MKFVVLIKRPIKYFRDCLLHESITGFYEDKLNQIRYIVLENSKMCDIEF